MDYLQSFPPQRTHAPCHQHYFPSWVQPQTNVEATKPPGVFEPWVYGSSYGYPKSMDCHSCCNHSYPSSYYTFRPPHSHLPPPPPSSQFYYHDPYSPYVDTFPTHYLPPHYPVEPPRFAIDKGMPESHCCGCPNHKCNGMKAKGVKIEEHDPEVKEKASELLGLPKIKNYPNPVVWVPPEVTNGVGKPSESDPRMWNGWFPYDMLNNKDRIKSPESEPKAWNGWIPLDLNSLKSLKQGGHEDEKPTEEEKEKIPQHPILWVPVLDKPVEAEKGGLKENEASPKDSEENQNKYRIIPVKFPHNFGVQAGPVEDTSATTKSKTKEDKVEHKSVPVMQMEDRREKNTLEDNQKKTRSITVKEAGELAGKELSSDKNDKRQSSSPPKTTKLPPVCLRVDPLPRRKSRSLSPPSKKVDGVSKVPSSPSMQDFVSKKENGSEKLKSKVVDVVEGTPDQSKNEDTRKLDHVQVPVDAPVVLDKVRTTEKAELRGKKDEAGKGVNEQAEENPKESVKEKKKISPSEAAVQIQCMYRGYEVRRWEPLKKLRQIARVREQVEEVRKQITSLESSNMQNNEKQRLLIGETIMNLLLQLDTIQGLHPSVREIRKSVARELICLQEKLDSLNSQLEVGLKPKETDVVCNVKPAMEEDKCDTGHAREHISIEPTDDPKDLILEKDESSGKSKESEQNQLQMSCSAVEEVEKQLAETENKVDEVKQQPIEPARYAVELDSTGDISVQTLPSTAMYNEMKHGMLQYSPEVVVVSEMEDKDLKSSPNEPVGSILVEGKEPDKTAEFNERAYASEVAAGSAAVEPREEVNLVKGDSYMGLQSLKVLPPEVKEEEPVTSNLKDENVFPIKYTEAKLDESEYPLVQEKGRGEEAELLEVSKPEEPLPEEWSNAEVHDEAEKIYDPLSSECISTQVPSLEFMEVTSDKIKNNIEELAAEFEVPKVQEMSPEETHNHSSPSLTVDALENMIEQLPAKEEVETQEFKEMTDKENLVDESCGSELVERKVMEEVVKEETGFTPRDVNINGSENDNLLKENEKLKEMLQKLIAAGNEQLNVISNLNGRVKDLEKKLTKNKKLRMRRKRTAAGGSH